MESKRIYDLEDRINSFVSETLIFVKTIKLNIYNENIIKQLIRSSTSVGTNYSEADDSERSIDFKHKIEIAKKEARETKYFLKLLKIVSNVDEKKLFELEQEIKEIHLILNSIYKKLKDKSIRWIRSIR